jgi:hypothetical protein
MPITTVSDSPVGLLAWLLEKYRAWDGAFSDDVILIQASLYWYSGTIATSFRPYWEFGLGRVERVRWVRHALGHSRPTTWSGTPGCRTAVTSHPSRDRPARG